ncbi:phage capsid protein [Altererythrobacter xixiisoli]|uniref:Phage capsid protein n=1 Tax=Croceibacterium xixiisoli TaxID=1476466 RepID=A0A6I4U1D3_9SPHN|nr:GPO family capsid scaffolding protein [Croceibacterium xixiisoli]MXP00474.1 phage capsid protein [Croceibacterium xixiisoli]
MAKSKFFCIAVEGATVDGREIKREWLEQMAASYDPKTYTARINCEHIAGYSPDAPFNAYGSVLALKTDTVELNINGEMKSLLGLFAEIEPNAQLIEMTKNDQKIFTSCEINPNFVGEGKAYLVGLAATDGPASLGTDRLKFAAMARPNVFTPAFSTAIDVVAEVDQGGIADAIRSGFAGMAAMFSRQDDKPKDPVTPPPAAANDNSFDIAAFSAAIGQQVAAAVQPAHDAIAAIRADFTALQGKLEATEDPHSFRRQPATGGGGNAAHLTDC